MTRWITAALLIAAWALLTAALEEPTESYEATAALELADSIQQARVAAKD